VSCLGSAKPPAAPCRGSNSPICRISQEIDDLDYPPDEELQMILPDVNVLIYAFRRDVSQHRVCRPWLAAVISSDTRFGLSPMVLSAVVRITTNSRAFRTPSAIDEAFGFCEDLLGQPHCQVVEPGERH
jgi:hypothetical protein